jgi:hypothetical protein
MAANIKVVEIFGFYLQNMLAEISVTVKNTKCDKSAYMESRKIFYLLHLVFPLQK